MAFGVFLVLVVLAMREVKMVGAAPSAAQCHEERALAIKACMLVVFGKSRDESKFQNKMG